MAVSYNFRKGIDPVVWEWLAPFPQGSSNHGTSNAFDGVRYLYWVIQYGTTATTASTTHLWQYDTWNDAWGFLTAVTSGNQGIDLEYDAVRNVLILTHGVSLTSWQVFNLNTTAITYANVAVPARSLVTMTPVLPAAPLAGASLTMPDDLSVIGALTPDGSAHVDEGIADATGNTTTTIVSTPETGTFGPGMVGLMVRVMTGAQAGQRRIITAVTNSRTLTVTPALPGALAAGDTYSIEVPEHTVSAATTTTVTNSASGTWAVNQYANSDVVFITGALAGQRRRIASNNADTLTLSGAVTGNARTGALTGTPGVGDIFRIVPSSDFLYYQPGNNSTALYRIDVAQTTGAAWSAALAVAPGGIGGGGNTFYPGRYAPFQIIAMRGGATNAVYAYNLGLNTWTTVTTYMASETFTTGASAAMMHGKRRMFIQKEGATRCYELDLTTGVLYPSVTMPYAVPGAYDGKRAKFIKSPDGAEYVYILRAGGQEFFRVATEWL